LLLLAHYTIMPKLSLTLLAVVVALALGTTVMACSDVRPLAVQHSHVFHRDLHPSGIPDEWVISGHPQARVKLLAQADDAEVRAALWDCTAGTFKWHFGADEVVHILEGEVQVSSENGATRTLKPGDVAYFSAGMSSVWHVPKYVKKLAIGRDNQEPFVRRAQRKLSNLFASL